MENHVDYLWTTCGKVLVPTSNSHVHTTLSTPPCGRRFRTTATKDGVIHISTGIYYLLPRYLPLGVIVPYGTRGRARGREEAWDHGPTPHVVREKARKTKASPANRHPTVSTVTRLHLDFLREKRETRTSNYIQANPVKEERNEHHRPAPQPRSHHPDHLSIVAVLAAVAGLLAGGVGQATAPALVIGLPVAIKATRSSNRRKAILRHADALAAQAQHQGRNAA